VAARICFATPGSYPLLAGRSIKVSGGSEFRALCFLRALEATGRYALSVIAFDHDDPRRPEKIGAISILRDPLYAPRASGVVARTRGYLASAMRKSAPAEATEWSAWEAADAKVYVTFGVAEYSAKLALWAKSRERHLVLFAGSDSDFSADYRPDAQGRNMYGSRNDRCHAAIQAAGAIVVQTETQRRLASERFGRDAVVIANPIELHDSDPQGVPDRPRGHALWIGKADKVKQPEKLIELARACTDLRFCMVLNPADRALFAEIEAARPANVEIIEHADRERIARLFVDAFCLVNTSVFEGFPNTFLEAGRHGVPVLSLAVDPDDIISRNRAGTIAHGRIGDLAVAARALHDDRCAAREAGARLRRYVRDRHDAAGRCAEFDGLLSKLIQDGPASRV
jgi:glycosyltransferase involved in cell wall biosynthesis